MAVNNVDEFLQRFGVAGHRSRLELLLQQYFDNGGVAAVVVRVIRSRRCNRIVLPGPAGVLVLDALNPGPLEHLRASVDYEGIPAGDRERFNLVIHRCRSPEQPFVEEQETYRDVSVGEAGNGEFIGNALMNSRLVRLEGEAPPERPTRTAGPGAGTAGSYVFCHADWQDSEAPTDYDLIGSREESTGLFALEQVASVDLICLLPGAPAAELGPVALFAAEQYARARNAILLLDPPASWQSVADVVRAQRQRGFPCTNALTYFPALENPPDSPVSGLLSAAGAIAGLLAAGDREQGPWAVPGPVNPLAVGRSRPAVALDESQLAQLVRLGVNALARPLPARVELHGSVTLARFGGVATSWNDLRQRRTALFAVSSIGRHTRWAAFEDPGPALWTELRAQVIEFLACLHARGAFAGERANESFYVKCDIDTNVAFTPSHRGVSFTVGLALHRPREFVAFGFLHTPTEWRVAELAWQPGLALAS